MPELLNRLLIRYHYLRKLGRLPNLRNPARFTEKIQRAKLTWRKPEMVAFADKVEAKKIVADRLGDDWITPTLFAGKALPPLVERTWPMPYVIKCNHRSGGIYFVHHPDQDWARIEGRLARELSTPYGGRLAEWVYREIEPQVLVEPFIGGAESPPDYKLYVFDGKVAFTSINWERFGESGVKRASFDRNWKRLPYTMGGSEFYRGTDLPEQPRSHAMMIAAAEELARDYPFVRVDFYEVDGKPRFGEVTFYPQSGLFKLSDEHDLELGRLWPDRLPV